MIYLTGQVAYVNPPKTRSGRRSRRKELENLDSRLSANRKSVYSKPRNVSCCQTNSVIQSHYNITIHQYHRRFLSSRHSLSWTPEHKSSLFHNVAEIHEEHQIALK